MSTCGSCDAHLITFGMATATDLLNKAKQSQEPEVRRQSARKTLKMRCRQGKMNGINTLKEKPKKSILIHVTLCAIFHSFNAVLVRLELTNMPTNIRA